MSLLLWMPFTDGTPKQQGLKTIEFSGTAPVSHDAGKLGKCGYCTQAYYNDNFTDLSSGIYSIAYWIKYTSFPTYNDYVVCINGTTSSDMLVSLGVQNSDGKLSVRAGASGTTLSLNTWYHIAYTANGSSSILYLNGQAIKTYNTVGNTSASHLTINGRYGSRPIHSFYLNDLRIYNHCLSAKEVEEIAKGLVLHYKLDDRFCESTTNLLAEAQSCPTYTNINLGQHVGSLSPATCACGNAIITYSAYIKNTSNVTVRVRCSPLLVAGGYGTFQGNIINPGEEGWSSVTCDLTDSTKYTGSIYLYFQNGSSGTVPSSPTFQVYHAQVEQKSYRTPWVLGGVSRNQSTVYDSSGYGNNGTIIGSLTTATPSPRYSVTTNFNGINSSNGVAINKNNFNLADNQFSISLWCKIISSINNGSAEYLICLNKTAYNGDMQFAFLHRARAFRVIVNNTEYAIQTLSLDTWYHIVLTFNGTNALTYINGVLINTTAISSTQYLANNLNLGARSSVANGSTQSFFMNGQLSDARIYATALTSEQVKELYTTSMSIDNNGNIHARELVEL